MFALNTDGTSYTTLHAFTNSDGAYRPDAGLILSGNTLYGTTVAGGTSGQGTVFAVNTAGSSFATLYSFEGLSPPFYSTNSTGNNPEAGLILSGNTLYGTARGGGISGNGTVFSVNTDGTGFKNLHDFGGYPSDGANPYARLVLSGNTIYGTAYNGGSSRDGTVFKVNVDGTGFTNLHSFTGGSSGANPYAGLILLGNTLYGTTTVGGSSGFGAVFSVNTDGTGFTNLHSFTGSDGANPYAGS